MSQEIQQQIFGDSPIDRLTRHEMLNESPNEESA